MDMIDKRNQKERIARSVIKRRNVVYSPVAYAKTEEAEEQKESEMISPNEEELAKAQEILERLRREAEADEAAKRAQIEELLAQQDEQQDAIQRILNEKEERIHRTMEDAQHSE